MFVSPAHTICWTEPPHYQTRITHIRPSELLIPTVSKSTEKMLQYFSGNRYLVYGRFARANSGADIIWCRRFNAGRTIRVERFGDQMEFTEAFDSLINFYKQDQQAKHKGMKDKLAVS